MKVIIPLLILATVLHESLGHVYPIVRLNTIVKPGIRADITRLPDPKHGIRGEMKIKGYNSAEARDSDYVTLEGLVSLAVQDGESQPIFNHIVDAKVEGKDKDGDNNFSIVLNFEKFKVTTTA